jgi:hypothetical protein
MTSYQSFTPGKKSGAGKIINYIAQYNAVHADTEGLKCACVEDKFEKNLSYAGSDSPSIRLPRNIRISQFIRSIRGGKTQYGNFYLGQPLNVNYLGRSEGMAGGSGTPPRNMFN